MTVANPGKLATPDRRIRTGLLSKVGGMPDYQLAPPDPDHPIWHAQPMATSCVAPELLRHLMGSPVVRGGQTTHCAQDVRTGVHVRVWRVSDDQPWFVAWTENPEYPESGRDLAEVLAGGPAGAELEVIP